MTYVADRVVREYTEPDREPVVALWKLVFADDPPRNDPDRVIERKLATQRELFLVALSRGRVVGTVLGGYDGFRGWIYHLAVHPEFQRSGFGRALMEESSADCACAVAPRSIYRCARAIAACGRSTSNSVTRSRTS